MRSCEETWRGWETTKFRQQHEQQRSITTRHVTCQTPSRLSVCLSVCSCCSRQLRRYHHGRLIDWRPTNHFTSTRLDALLFTTRDQSIECIHRRRRKAKLTPLFYGVFLAYLLHCSVGVALLHCSVTSFSTRTFTVHINRLRHHLLTMTLTLANSIRSILVHYLAYFSRMSWELTQKCMSYHSSKQTNNQSDRQNRRHAGAELKQAINTRRSNKKRSIPSTLSPRHAVFTSVPANGLWRSLTGEATAGLAAQWSCVKDFIVLSIHELKGSRNEDDTLRSCSRGSLWLTLGFTFLAHSVSSYTRWTVINWQVA